MLYTRGERSYPGPADDVECVGGRLYAGGDGVRLVEDGPDREGVGGRFGVEGGPGGVPTVVVAVALESAECRRRAARPQSELLRALRTAQCATVWHICCGTDAYRVAEAQEPHMEGRRVWVSVRGEPRPGTVVERTFTPKKGSELLAVELDDPVDGTGKVVVNPHVDDVLFEPD